MEWVAAICFIVGFGVLMPLIIGGFSLQEKKIKLQRELAQMGGGDLRRELDETKAEVTRLKDRIAVLERLATNEDVRLASQIDRLRRPEAGA